ncbi:MAG: NAD-dependent epimerase/dehydratase family protein [Nitrospirae bacterium]|nr:NAD-dependent epimerase/dehydratase family protein [Nitrospirota bacterium]
MNVMVTGGAGFIGSHIVDAMVESGAGVSVVDSLVSGMTENLNTAASFHRLDIRDSSLDDVFKAERPDVVIHMAAQMDVRASVADPVYDADVNVVGSLNLLQCCIRHGVKRFVFASSGGAVYGEQETFPAAEDHPKRPLSPYGITKIAVEHYLYYYRAVHGLGYAALRFANVYGPRQDPHGEAGVVAIFAGKMLDGETPVINGDGGQTRDYVYVSDVVRANVLAVHSQFVGSLNVGTGVEVSVNELYEKLKAATGYEGEVKHGPAKAGEQLRSVIDCGLIGRELGWSPRVALEEGLMETVGFFRKRRTSVQG